MYYVELEEWTKLKPIANLSQTAYASSGISHLLVSASAAYRLSLL